MSQYDAVKKKEVLCVARFDDRHKRISSALRIWSLIEKIQSSKKPNGYRKKILNILKRKNFSAIPLVISEIDEYCQKNSCLEEINYKRYLNTLGILYRAGVLRRF